MMLVDDKMRVEKSCARASRGNLSVQFLRDFTMVEREREREGERGREREREREREGEREGGRERGREGEREGRKEREEVGEGEKEGTGGSASGKYIVFLPFQEGSS